MDCKTDRKQVKVEPARKGRTGKSGFGSEGAHFKVHLKKEAVTGTASKAVHLKDHPGRLVAAFPNERKEGRSKPVLTGTWRITDCKLPPELPALQRTPELIDAVGSEVDRVLSLDDFWASGGSDAASPSKPKRTALLESALLRESGRVSVDSVMLSLGIKSKSA